MNKKSLESYRKEKSEETKRDSFRKRIDQHFRVLNQRYRMMRKTVNANRISADDAELIILALNGVTEKFVSFLKSRIEEESDITPSIWQ